MDRVNYILSDKPEHAQALMLRNFRPVKDGEKVNLLLEAYFAQVKPLWKACLYSIKPLWKAYEAQKNLLWEAYVAQVDLLHDLEWPDNSWTGTSIFSKN